MKQNRLALFAVALATTLLSAPSHAQAKPSSVPSRFGATYSLDPFAKDARDRATLAVTYRVSTCHDLLGRKGFDVDLSGIFGASGDAPRLGVAALHTWEVAVDVVREFRPRLTLTTGPSLLYGAAGGGMRLGWVFGVGATF